MNIEPRQYESIKKLLPSDDVISQCMHCGMCLAVCPTYNETFEEQSSPRGRIRLIKAVADGVLPITDKFMDEMDFCLDCQACETACPAGVKYGSMVEAARVVITKQKANGAIGRWMKKIGMNVILASPTILRFFSRFFYAYQQFGIRSFMHKSGLFRLFGKNFAEYDKLLPDFSKTFSVSVIKPVMPPYGQKKHTVAFLTGCLMDVAFAEINIDTVKILQRNGCEVITPRQQYCCGSLHAHYGEMDKAVSLARKNLDAFDGYQFDYLVANSAGCGAFMKEYAHIFEHEPQYAEKAKKFSAKVRDITEFLAENEPTAPLGQVEGKITYHDACHLAHTQKVTKQPRKVIMEIPGVDYVELPESTWCCGSAGIYNVVRYDDSMKFLNRKIENLKQTNADVVVMANPGCLLQMKYGVEKQKLPIEVIHTVTLLERSYCKAEEDKNSKVTASGCSK